MNDEERHSQAPFEWPTKPATSSMPHRSPWAQRWVRVVDRRRAQCELDRLLGRPSRPDIAETYGLSS